MNERDENIYRPGPDDVAINSFDDLMKSNIFIVRSVVEDRWGSEAAAIYQEVMAAHVRQRMFPGQQAVRAEIISH